MLGQSDDSGLECETRGHDTGIEIVVESFHACSQQQALVVQFCYEIFPHLRFTDAENIAVPIHSQACFLAFPKPLGASSVPPEYFLLLKLARTSFFCCNQGYQLVDPS